MNTFHSVSFKEQLGDLLSRGLWTVSVFTHNYREALSRFQLLVDIALYKLFVGRLLLLGFAKWNVS